MAKQKIYGVLESDTVLLEPLSETRYQLDKALDAGLIGAWLTVTGAVTDRQIGGVEVATIEKNSGKTTRTGLLVATAPNPPAEANGAGGFLYQEKKGRYFLLSSGAPNGPIQGDFTAFLDREVKVVGEYGEASYILYNAKVTAKD